MKKRLLVLLLLPVMATAQYKVELNRIKYPVQPTMWGLFFEDINRSGDGGIYGDLVKNRSFDFPDAFMGWGTAPARREYAKNEVFQIINHGKQHENNPKYLQVTLDKDSVALLANGGFGGLSLEKGANYELIIVARKHEGSVSIKAEFLNGRNLPIINETLAIANGSQWQTLKTTIVAGDTTVNGRLLIRFDGRGKLDIDRISLFPTETWKQRSEGMRTDLVQKLYDIQPGFMRFPGGCIVEGESIETRYQWKNTIGPVLERKLNSNQWSSGGASGRPMKDYFQSYGLGFFEYFQLCEDMNAEPMPILNCGLSCQFGTGEVIATEEMDTYVQDALDLIEFANGDASTTWGKKRIELGHPATFNMKLLGVGNENWGPQYVERLLLFTKAIKAKYPYIQLIASTGYSPNPQFKYMDSVLRKIQVDIIDEHYYETVNWFLKNANKYDNYDRKGPKIFIGEYACHSLHIGNAGNKNTQLCALAEAAWMTGLERNADIVTMAAYAPLFAHIKDWQWTPNLIWFDNTKSYATPSYYVQQMFSLNKGTDVVPIVVSSESGVVSGKAKDKKTASNVNGEVIAGQDSIWASAVIDKKTNELIIKLVNPSGSTKTKTIEISDFKRKTTTGTVIVLKGDPAFVNSLEKEEVVPVTKTIAVTGKKISLNIDAYSFNVVKVKL
jgi:alpha-N-arabinofuranosidase